MNKDKELKEKIIAEYYAGGISYQGLANKYGYSKQSIWEWVKAFEGKKRIRTNQSSIEGKGEEIEIPKKVKELEAELHRTKLRNKLLEEVIRLNEEETGVDLIKKAGTKRS